MAPRDERRTDPVHPPKPPGKKDRAKWCRGKVGVEHVPVVAIPPNAWGDPTKRTCGPSSYFTMYREWTRWSCRHVWMCTACGKHLPRRVTQEECEASEAAQVVGGGEDVGQGEQSQPA